MIRRSDGAHICDYCLKNPAEYYFETVGKWCCSSRIYDCPYFGEKVSKTKKGRSFRSKTKLWKLEQKISHGAQCKYCDSTANYLLTYDIYCCSEKARECPEFNNWLSNKMKQRYIEHPEYREFQRKNIKKINNRPEVIEKKQEKMLALHHGDCEPCKEFQSNYNKGRDDMRKTYFDKWTKECLDFGYEIEEIPKEYDELRKFIRRHKQRVRREENTNE